VHTLAAADQALCVNAYDAVRQRLRRGRARPDASPRRRAQLVHLHRRGGWNVPVLFLTARDRITDRVAGEAGGDDYLVKPFVLPELVHRVRSLCRRDPSGFPGETRCLIRRP
jgi:CheY-like chemotaxis protein